MFIRVWEYQVVAGEVDAFVAAYGPGGDWAQLFRRGAGYVGTELYRRVDGEASFITVDRWADEAAWRAFLDEWRETYDGLDASMTPLTASQHSVLEGTPRQR